MARGRGRIINRVPRHGRNQVGNVQLELLISYMEQHLLFARGQVTRLGPQGHIKYRNMWLSLTNLLNSIGPSIKDEQGWQRFWTNLRLAAKTKKASFLKDLNRTGHNPPAVILSENDQRISDIYGRFGTGVNIDKELGLCITSRGEPQVVSNPEVELLLTELPEVLNNITAFLSNPLVAFNANRSKAAQKPNQRQMDYLVFRMSRHIEHAREEIEDSTQSMEFWTETATHLNSIPGGCVKQYRAWMRTWSDLVGAARQNWDLVVHGMRNTPLPENHLRVLRIMGDLPLAPLGNDGVQAALAAPPNVPPARPAIHFPAHLLAHPPAGPPARQPLGLPAGPAAGPPAGQPLGLPAGPAAGQPLGLPAGPAAGLPAGIPADPPAGPPVGLLAGPPVRPAIGNNQLAAAPIGIVRRDATDSPRAGLLNGHANSSANLVSRVLESAYRQRDTCGSNQLANGFNGQSIQTANSVPSKRFCLDNSIRSLSEPEASTSSSNGNINHTNRVAGQTSRVMAQLETKASALITTLLERFQEVSDLQTGLIQSYIEDQTRLMAQNIENQNRLLLEHLPILLHQLTRDLRNAEPVVGNDVQVEEHILQNEEVAAEEVLNFEVPQQQEDNNGANEGELDELLAFIQRDDDNAMIVVDEPQDLPVENLPEVPNPVNECSICYSEVKRSKQLKCGHIFCRGCIKLWLARKNTCPNCRAKIQDFQVVNNIITFSLDSDSDSEPEDDLADV